MKLQPKGAFTILELLTVLALLALLAVTLFPAVARTSPESKAIRCLNNFRQLTLGWQLYANDFNDRVCNNLTLPDTQAAITSGRFDNWANNVMSWGASLNIADVSTTNADWAGKGLLGRYTGNALGIYKCPADTFLSPVQIAHGYTQRLRSCSMSGLFGWNGSGGHDDRDGRAWFDQSYRQYLRQSDVRVPALTWVTLDEHPDSINDTFFIVGIGATQWGDLPGSLHNGACSFSFADGHAELHRWRSTTSIYPVRFTFGTRSFDVAGKLDYQWYKDRTGYLLYR